MEEKNHSGKQFWLLVGAITFLALALRLYRLAMNSFWLDEAYTAGLAKLSWGELLRNWPCDLNPFLSSRFYRWWMTFAGDEQLSIELFSALAGTLSIPIAALVARQCFGERVAVWTAALFAVSALHIRFSQFTRIFAVTLFFLLLGALVLSLVVRRERSLKAWFLVPLLAVLSYLHYIAFLTFILLYLYVVFFQVSRERRPQYLLIFCAGLILSAPSIYNAATLYGLERSATWIQSPIENTFASIWFHLSSESLGLLTLFASAIALGIKRSVTGDGYIESLSFCAAWVVLPVATLFLMSLFGVSAFHVRYFIFILPPFLMLAAWGFSRLGPTNDVVFILPFVLVFSGNSLSDYYFEQLEGGRKKANYLFVNKNFQDGDVVLHTSKCSFAPASFYAREHPNFLFSSAKASTTLQCLGVENLRVGKDIFSTHARVWIFNEDCFPDRATSDIFKLKEFKDRYPRLLYESPDGTLFLFDLSHREIIAEQLLSFDPLR